MVHRRALRNRLRNRFTPKAQRPAWRNWRVCWQSAFNGVFASAREPPPGLPRALADTVSI